MVGGARGGEFCGGGTGGGASGLRHAHQQRQQQQHRPRCRRGVVGAIHVLIIDRHDARDAVGCGGGCCRFGCGDGVLDRIHSIVVVVDDDDVAIHVSRSNTSATAAAAACIIGDLVVVVVVDDVDVCVAAAPES